MAIKKTSSHRAKDVPIRVLVKKWAGQRKILTPKVCFTLYGYVKTWGKFTILLIIGKIE